VLASEPRIGLRDADARFDRYVVLVSPFSALG
jgi:hypothetical protein